MRTAAIALIVLAVACEALSYWGLETVAGQRAFDEMAGIIPFAAGLLGALLAACAAVLWWIQRRKRYGAP